MGWLSNPIKRFVGGVLSIAGAIVAYAGGPYAPLGYAMIVAGGALMQSGIEKKGEQLQRPANHHQLNTRSSREPLPLIYGVSRVGVNKTYYLQDNPYLWIVCELGEGPIKGIQRDDGTNYFTDVDTEFPTDNPPRVYFDEKLWTEYGSGNVWMKFYSGTAAQAVCSDLATASGGAWTEPLHYTAYLVVRLTFELKYFKQEPEITAVVYGLQCNDPIASTTDWTDNAALIAYDFMTRSSQRGGLEIDPARIDTTSLETARDYCTAKSWSCYMPIKEQQAASDNLEQILSCYRGAIIYSDAKFKFRFADLNYESVSLALDEDDVVEGTLQIDMPDISDRPNAIKATYYDMTKGWKQNDFTYSDSAAITAEGDYREMSINLLGLVSNALVQKMCYYILERERLKKTVSFVAGERCAALEPFDVITLTHSMPGWTAQYLRVMSATINPENHTVSLSCQYESAAFYDDVYEVTEDDFDSTSLLDPSATPPEVEGVTLTEEVYVFRLRSQSRINVTFSTPTDYPWFDHVEVWVSLDDANWSHQFNAAEDFTIDPAEENKTYYVKLVSVNIWGTKMTFDGAPKYSCLVDGKSDTAPSSLSGVSAIVTSNGVNIYADKVTDNDIELYEFRLGASWTGSVFLAAQRSAELSLSGVRPGTHTVWMNTLGTNGLYGETPVSVSFSIRNPPDGWAVHSTYGPATNRVTNGDFEAVGGWQMYGTPTTNARTTALAHEGDYGYIFSADGTAEGAQSTSMTLVAGAPYGYSIWVYPTEPSINIRVIGGDGSSVLLNTTHTGLTTGAWNLVSGTFSEVTGGSSGKAIVCSGDLSTGTWYLDNFIILRGETSNAIPYMYNSEDYVKLTHPSTIYSGEWKSQIYDASSSQRFMAYLDTSYTVIGTGSYWSDLLPTTATLWSEVLDSTKTWAAAFAPEAAPKIYLKLNYGASTDLGSTVERMEILNGIVIGRYFQVVASIIDPQPNIYGLVKSPTLRLAT